MASDSLENLKIYTELNIQRSKMAMNKNPKPVISLYLILIFIALRI